MEDIPAVEILVEDSPGTVKELPMSGLDHTLDRRLTELGLVRIRSAWAFQRRERMRLVSRLLTRV